MEIGADRHDATVEDIWVTLVLLVKEHMDNQ
jgi:hypothetical protein